MYKSNQTTTQVFPGVLGKLGRQGLSVETPQGVLAREQLKHDEAAWEHVTFLSLNSCTKYLFWGLIDECPTGLVSSILCILLRQAEIDEFTGL